MKQFLTSLLQLLVFILMNTTIIRYVFMPSCSLCKHQAFVPQELKISSVNFFPEYSVEG